MCRGHCFCLPRAGLGQEQKYKSGFLLTRGRYDDKRVHSHFDFRTGTTASNNFQASCQNKTAFQNQGRSGVMSCQGTSVVTAVVVTTTSRLHQLSPLLSQLNKRKQKKSSAFRNRKRTFEHRRLVKSSGFFFPDSVSRLFPPSQSPQPFDVPRGLRSKSRDLGE